uniref:Uncharacterized protein n=1 Tax=Rhizochromulina marina TaxID=1034831 RepID=A0A7S2SDW3_9STRA|mmetsp:Transcript_28782/g.84062  ORF Transcript_28782/g.84062 Transcript_28782/m.84062 type:complete len:428 (+) Transcript_28782:89-1372(+)
MAIAQGDVVGEAYTRIDGDPSVLGDLLRRDDLPVDALMALEPEVVSSLALLVAQAVGSGIDYAELGQGWDHPTAKTAYRKAEGRSFMHPASVARQDRSREDLGAVAMSLPSAAPETQRDLLVQAFLREIGVDAEAAQGWDGDFKAVHQALRAELVLPLRSLNEGRRSMYTTFNGHALPGDKISALVDELLQVLVEGHFKDWRYTNPVGRAQLHGLSDHQVAVWKEASRTVLGNLVVHEDEEDELGFFWATKIGGPSHGFDIEGQCLLPLIANARHKVVLVSDPAWPFHPTGRAHLRLLFTAEGNRPLLWLEVVNQDFVAQVDSRRYIESAVRHAILKSDRMGIPLSLESHLESLASSIVSRPNSVKQVQDKLVLRPSKAVVEASDYLSHKHDWVQLSTEVSPAIRRVLYTPQLKSKEAPADFGQGDL